MGRIVLFGGTVEGRLLAQAFQKTQLEIHVCVATEYGATLLPEAENIYIHSGRMTEEQMVHFLTGIVPDVCLDATHPYAAAVTKNIAAACHKTGSAYIRIQRGQGMLPDRSDGNEGRVLYLESIEEAAEYLNHTTGNILITTGSRDLEKYTVIDACQKRCFARVLPTLSVMAKCKELGFEGKNLIGMQGPFSAEMNYCMLKQIGASFLVTKDSGNEGGFAEKWEAARRAGAALIVVGAPAQVGEERQMCLAEAIRWLCETYHLQPKRQLFLIGMGPGDRMLLTQQAADCIRECDVVIGADRMLAICEGIAKKPSYSCYQAEKMQAFLKEHPEYQRVALVYSGDIGFYSGARSIREYFPEDELHPVSGISSVVYFLDQLKLSWEDVRLVSFHGRKNSLIRLLKEEQRVCALLGKKEDFWQLCRELLEFGMEEVNITVGERLSYPEERIFTGTAAKLQNAEIESLSVALFERRTERQLYVVPGIRDDAFVRGNIPMTKQEIRVLSLAKLALTKTAVVYDVGAGTGSVAVEMANCCTQGQIYAIEKKEEGVRLILENKRRFQVENLSVIEGEAPECFKGLPAPTHVFIGGSKGRLAQIVHAVRRRNPEARFVANAVTWETIAQLKALQEEIPEYRNMEFIQVNVSKGTETGRCHMIHAQNPVWIFSFGGACGNGGRK
ncbi:MAG: precorrin-6A reductase [Clostridiaceae bacterium]|nr:precorrin-6A reductase [Clostridiaceae bacterium]